MRGKTDEAGRDKQTGTETTRFAANTEHLATHSFLQAIAVIPPTLLNKYLIVRVCESVVNHVLEVIALFSSPPKQLFAASADIDNRFECQTSKHRHPDTVATFLFFLIPTSSLAKERIRSTMVLEMTPL